MVAATGEDSLKHVVCIYTRDLGIPIIDPAHRRKPSVIAMIFEVFLRERLYTYEMIGSSGRGVRNTEKGTTVVQSRLLIPGRRDT